jgi:hypothetical protein
VSTISVKTLKRLLWLLASPLAVLAALLYFWLAWRKARRERNPLAVLTFPYGAVMFLTFITPKVARERGPYGNG